MVEQFTFVAISREKKTNGARTVHGHASLQIPHTWALWQKQQQKKTIGTLKETQTKLIHDESVIRAVVACRVGYNKQFAFTIVNLIDENICASWSKYTTSQIARIMIIIQWASLSYFVVRPLYHRFRWFMIPRCSQLVNECRRLSSPVIAIHEAKVILPWYGFYTIF